MNTKPEKSTFTFVAEAALWMLIICCAFLLVAGVVLSLVPKEPQVPPALTTTADLASATDSSDLRNCSKSQTKQTFSIETVTQSATPTLVITNEEPADLSGTNVFIIEDSSLYQAIQLRDLIILQPRTNHYRVTVTFENGRDYTLEGVTEVRVEEELVDQ